MYRIWPRSADRIQNDRDTEDDGMRPTEIIFEVTETAEGGYGARALGYSIFTHVSARRSRAPLPRSGRWSPITVRRMPT